MFLAFLIQLQQANVALFAITFLLRSVSLALKYAFVTKFACANLALKISAAKVLNSGVAIYLS